MLQGRCLFVQIAGNVSVGADYYFLAIKTLKRSVFYFLIAQEPVRNNNADSVVIKDAGALPRYYSKDYLVESIKRSKVTGKVQKWGDGNVIELLLDAISYAKTYSFSPDNIQIDADSTVNGVRVHTFSAKDHNIEYTYTSSDGEYITLSLSHGLYRLNLRPLSFNAKERGLKYFDVSNVQRSKILRASVKTVTVSDLDEVLDMSWYHKDGKCLKNYQSIGSIYDFELNVMTPLIQKAMAATKKNPVVVTLDTETTGVNVYNLSVNNPDRSHCVSVQLSWEDNSGVVIFTDMECFQSISNEYVAKRLEQLFHWYQDENTVEYWEQGITGFKDTTQLRTLSSCIKRTAIMYRWQFFLVGHNFPFDRRTMYQTKNSDIWFNADTLQMAFDLNPQLVRGNNKLKVLTRRLVGHETPELTDVLGAGNEDKYRYLVDKEVACIYGCADVDYTRKIFFILRKLMQPAMFMRYLRQDVDISNILAISEYYGMNTLEDEVLTLAEQTRQNLEILKKTAWSYVGVYVDYLQQVSMLDTMHSAGVITTDEEYERQKAEIQVNEDAMYEFEFKGNTLREILYKVLNYPIYGYTDGAQSLPKVDKYVITKLKSKKREKNTKMRELKHDVLAYGVDPGEYLRLKNGNDQDKKKAKQMCLIEADEFNGLKYPLALLVFKYADLNKEYTSYYKPIIEGNLEGKIFKSYSLARIETRRIQNPGQTMKGNLKALVRSYSDDYYLLDFDMSQVEYRIMLSLAKYVSMVERMKNPERDYHTETASMINNIPPHKVSKKVRKEAKSVSFGVPYGLGDRSLCETMFGTVNDETLFATRILLAKWKENNSPVMDLLENAREQALTEWQIDDDFRDFIRAWETDENGEYVLDENGSRIPIPISRVTNDYGFYRIFSLKNIGLTKADIKRRAEKRYDAAESSIRRKAGNFPIQSYAAELFRIILIRFYWRCVKEGIADKIIWHMLIHDELLCSVHKSIHPFYLYKLVKESCMVTKEGHTKYFVGINIGDTWAECKDDAREAPIFFVNRIVKQWDSGMFSPEKTDPVYLKNGDPSQGYWFDHPWEFIQPLRKQFVKQRIGEALRAIVDIDNEPINVPVILEKFDNYTVRAYVNDYPQNGDIDKCAFAIDKDVNGNKIYNTDALDNAIWSSKLESWALDVFGEGKQFIKPDGTVIRLRKRSKEAINEDVLSGADDFIDVEELFKDESFESERDWSFDKEDIVATYAKTDIDLSENEFEEDYAIDFTKSRTAKNVAEMFIRTTKYQVIHVVNGQVIIPYKSKQQIEKCKIMLSKYKSSVGLRIVFKDILGHLTPWIKILENADLLPVDSMLYDMNQLYEQNKHFSSIYCQSGRAIVPVKNRLHMSNTEKYLKTVTSGNIPVVFKTSLNEMIVSKFSIDINELANLDRFIMK